MSKLEETYAFQLKAAGIVIPEREYRFHDTRRWRFDFAWPDQQIAIEIEGGIWTGGAHTRGKHFISDCDKYNTATIMGWRVLRFTETHIKQGSALQHTEEILSND